MTDAAHAVSSGNAWYDLERRGETLRLAVGGSWVISEARRLDPVLRKLDTGGLSDVEIDCGALDRVDTTGAWLLLRTKRILEHRGVAVRATNVRPEYRALVHTIDHECRAPPVEIPRRHSIAAQLERIGRSFCHALHQGYELIGFFGLVVFETVATIVQPRRLRLAALVRQMEETGLNALPIVGLLSFLVGVVFAYQGSDQLREFGAELFTVNLLGIGFLRELGGLLAAIIVAGRSGSAFTAQIGTMKVSEELDAIQVSGFNVVEVLVLPRLLGIVITLPLLTFYSNVMGIIGGAAMCYLALGITFPAFLHQLQTAVIGWTFWVGLIKAPVFASIIALVGCHQGFQVERNASSVGRHTTQAVVESIFLVIVADAAFSIMFSWLGL
ncbi:MAG TPA: MlaE family lipid ABC transporter permease subunit [Acetobacteraceae bacterium]|nr:MlaE family lipid ABC transporter permease subunit [Acetobacteraceae bacterium]